MNIHSGVFLAGGELVAITDSRSIYLSRTDSVSYKLVSSYQDIRFLTASPYGEYIAFWSITGESFRLVDLSGQELWSSWMNSDKAVPTGIKFSATGDALACFFHFDGVPGMFFCDIGQLFSTTFGCCGRTIGHDNDLRYFVLSDYDPYEYDKLPFFEVEPASENIVKLSPEIVSAKLDNGPVILNRKRCIISQPASIKEMWGGLAIQTDMAGFVVQRKGDVSWFSYNSQNPEITIKHCLPESAFYQTYCKIMSLSGDNVLIQMKDKATAVNLHNGVIWSGDDLSSVLLRGQRILAQYDDGKVEVVRSDGSMEMCLPQEEKIIAADIKDDTLIVANTLGLRRYALGHNDQ
jgi:hypothetical protein